MQLRVVSRSGILCNVRCYFRCVGLVRTWAFACVAVCAAGAAVTATAVTKVDRPVPDDVRGCATRGDSNHPAKPPATGAVKIGPLIIWPTVHRVGPTTDKLWPYATKAPVMLPARVRATLSIALEAEDRAGLWRMRGGYVSTVRFLACREREPSHGYRGTVGKFTQFPFSFALKDPSACVPMEVWLDGESAPHRLVVPVGRSSC
jgi:hypothetical protein